MTNTKSPVRIQAKTVATTRVVSILAILMFLGLASYSEPAQKGFVSMNFVVTKTADTADGVCDADCSLREAIIAANANPVPDTITFLNLGGAPDVYILSINPGLETDYDATIKDLDITDDVTITGNGAANTFVQGGVTANTAIDRVFDVATGSVTFQDLTIRFGKDTGDSNFFGASSLGGGGAIAVRHTTGTRSVTVIDCSITDNVASTGNGGGAIFLTANGTSSLTISGSTISNNSTTGVLPGGGIFADTGTIVSITNSSVSSNTTNGAGGGISCVGCVLLIDQKTMISDNTAAGQGGGIYSDGGIATITDSTISDNTSSIADGGGIYTSSGIVLMNTSTVSGNMAEEDGGGIACTNCILDMSDSAVFGNAALFASLAGIGGGGLKLAGIGVVATITDSTISGNFTFGSGGGIAHTGIGKIGTGGFITVTNATISGNEAYRDGGGVFLDDAIGLMTLNSVTVTLNKASEADNRLNIAGADGGGLFLGSGTMDVTNSIVAANSDPQDGSNPDVFGAMSFDAFSLVGVDPVLGPLQNNGGQTETHALLLASPARDAANALTSPSTDQRGVVRPSGAGDDIGAFELDVSMADLSLTKTVDNPIAGMNDTVVFTITVTNDGPGDATSVTVTDAQPAGLTFDSSNASQGTFTAPTWNVGALAGGASATLDITATVTTTTAVVNSAEITAIVGVIDPDSTPNNADPTEDDQASAGIGSADLRLTKTVDVPMAALGDPVSFTVSVTNDGPQDASGVFVTDVVPAGLTGISSTPSQGSYVGSSWDIGTIGVGNTVTLVINGTANANGDITNTAQVSASDLDDPDSTPDNNAPSEDDQDSATVTVPDADLSLGIFVDNPNPATGESVTFTLALMNSGADPVTGVEVTSLLPLGLDFVSASPTAGTYDSGTGVWAIASVDRGEELILSARVTVVGAITTEAEVTAADQVDPDSTPNNGVLAEDDQDSVDLTASAPTNPAGVVAIVVNTLADENDGSGAGLGTSLRDAIAESVASIDVVGFNSPSTTILFDASILGGTITLTLGELVIDKDIIIDGPGSDQLIVSGGSTQRVFHVNVIPTGTNTSIATIMDLTIADGMAQGGDGGAAAAGGGGGGAGGLGGGVFINSGSELKVINSVFDGNNAFGGNGGASSGTGIVGGGGGGGMGGNGATTGVDGDGGVGGGGGILGGVAGAVGSGTAGGVGGEGAGGGGGGGNATGDMSGGAGGYGGGGAGGGIVGDASTADGGNGGYGGGGGGAGSISGGTPDGGAGQGGLFGGNGAALAKSSANGGGGGGGLGGAVFIRNGGTFTASETTFQNNTASGGMGGSNASAGKGKGGAIFVAIGGTYTEDTNTYVSNAAADATGSSNDTNDIYGLSLSGSLVVSIATDEDDGDLSGNDLSLREAILYSVAGDTITFDPSLTTLTIDQGDLFIDKDLTITGLGVANLTIDGGGTQRIFFVNSGTVIIEEMTLSGGLAQGGDGAPAQAGGGGGGGAGMGGAVFVNTSAVLTLQGIDFSGNSSMGGAGALSDLSGGTGGFGGGGFGGNAPTGIFPGDGGDGGLLGGAGGAIAAGDGGDGGDGGGGGGGNSFSGVSNDGGAGGFAGGGGGGGAGNLANDGGGGGFGGGGGGGGFTTPNTGGVGGFGGGAGGTNNGGGGGGGGAGMGGALFVRAGATVTVSNSSFNNNTATAGLAGTPGAADGLGKGGGLFLMSGTTFVNGGGLTFSANTAEDAGAAGSLDNDDAFGLSLGGGVNVTIASDEDDGDLSTADISLREAVGNAVAGDVITFDAALTLITVDQGDIVIDKNLTIMGNGAANLSIDGGNAQRIFFVNSGVVTIQDLKIINGSAQGGDGGAAEAAGSGGGASGMGGAIFVNSSAALTVSGVDFMDNSAIGGDGGTTGALMTLAIGAGGGGFGGDGNTNNLFDNIFGGNGGASGSLGGGDGLGTTNEGRDGEEGNGGGGGGNSGTSSTDGGLGGFAGGGGGGGVAGASALGGDGGFGGGGGGTGIVGASTGGLGGFGGGDGGADVTGAGGGGAAGFGGAIFVRENASLTISNSNFVNSTATAGTAGTPGGGTNGLAKGGALFVMTGASVTNNGNVTFTNSMAADAGNSSFDTPDVFGVAFGGTIIVDNATDEDDGDLSTGDVSLREAIANAAPGNTIAFDNALAGSTLTTTLGDLVVDKDLTIDGAGAAPLTISGGMTQRVFLVDSGNVTILNLTIAGGNAQGGDGGAGDGQSGGGGAGLGGGLFVNSGANVTLQNVLVDGNMATGGNGGANSSTGGSGSGGGGIGGNGSDPASGGSGGSGGILGGVGGAGTSGSGDDGSVGGDGAGGGGGGASSVASRPGGRGGSGGFGGGGGAGGSATAPAVESGVGGTGGFGGGSGGAGYAAGVVAPGPAGTGGLFGGDGGSSANLANGGGGGAGLGAGVFVRTGGSLTIQDSAFTNNSAIGGGGGAKNAGSNGQGKGGGIFVMNGGTLVNLGGTTFSGNAASDQSGAIGDNDDVYKGMVVGLTVTTLADELDMTFNAADLSLREAIAAALPGDVIDFHPAILPGTIALDNALGELAITRSVGIAGPGADMLSISGQNLVRVFNVSDADAGTSMAVSIAGLTIANGNATEGAGILNDEALSIQDSALVSNTATGGLGGGLSSRADSTTTIDRSLFDANSASGGGAVYNIGVMTIADSTISGNASSGTAGGILNDGGIADSGTLTLSNSTIVFNSGSGGGATGGILTMFPSSATLTNTIVAGNMNDSPGVSSDVEGTFTGDANNLIGDTTGSAGFGASDLDLAILGITDLGDVFVQTLAGNGGPTMTHALVGGSVALDAGDNAFASTTDQRGLTRIVDSTFTGTPTVDIGAYEYDGPVIAVAPVTVMANEDDPPLDNAVDLNAVFDDVNDVDSSLIYTIESVTPAGIVTAIIDGTGMLDLTFAADAFGDVNIVLRATDPNGQYADAIQTVQVAPFNDNPMAVDDSFGGIQENSVDNVLDVLANDDIAPDVGETLTISAVGVTSNGGAVTNNGSDLSYTPAPNFLGMETFTYTVDDGNGGSAQATVTVTVVEGVNNPPTATDDIFTGIVEDSVGNTLNVLMNDNTLPDVGETLTITSVGATSAGGSVTNNGTDLSYTPAANFFGTETFTYTIGDGNGGTAQATVSVTVDNVNDPPTAVDDSFQVLINSINNVLDVLSNDSAAPDAGETLTITDVTVPANGIATIVSGTTIFYTPMTDFAGTDTFMYTIDDGNGGSDMAVVTVELCRLSAIEIVSPVDGAEIIVGTGTPSLRFNFEAIPDCSDDVAEVTFDLDGTVLGTFTSAPYEVFYTEATAMLLGAHTLTVTATGAADPTNVVLATSDFSVRLATAMDDSNADCLPDNPFVTAPIAGDVWYCTDVNVPGFAVSVLHLELDCAVNAPPQILTLEDPRDATRRVTITVPCGLLEVNETAFLIMILGQDTTAVLGANEAGLLASEPGGLTLGGQYVEISVIVTADDGATFFEIDNARLAANPISIMVEGLAGVDADTGLYSHPTFVDSDPATGLMVVAESGNWTSSGFTNVATTSTTIGADVVSLSVVAPFQFVEPPPPPGGCSSGSGSASGIDGADAGLVMLMMLLLLVRRRTRAGAPRRKCDVGRSGQRF